MNTSERPEQSYVPTTEKSIETQLKPEAIEPAQLKESMVEQSSNDTLTFTAESEQMVSNFEKSHEGEGVSEQGKQEIQQLDNEAASAAEELKGDLAEEDAKIPIERDHVATPETNNPALETIERINTTETAEMDNETAFMDSDPRYKAIADELSDKEVKESVQRYKDRTLYATDTDAEYQLLHFSHGFRRDESGKLRYKTSAGALQRMFKERYPEDYQQYLQKEKGRIYDRADDDPQFRELTDQLKSLQGKYKDAEEKSSYIVNMGGTGVSGWRQFRPQNADHTAERLATYNNFASQFLEKAQAYRKFDKDLDEALKRQEATQAKNTEQQDVADEPKTAETTEVQQAQPEKRTATTATEKLAESFRQQGVESQVVKLQEGGEFAEAIVLSKQEVPTEKMVRIYRGINHMDNSVLEQVPYAMRKEHESGKPETLQDLKQEVNELAHNPTYENLIAYAEKVRPHLNREEAQRMDSDLAGIEDGILAGEDLRTELIYDQIKHGGGWGDRGISPYISASHSPFEAAGYGREGLVVIDIPVSELEDFRADSTEVNIKGSLDKKYITAVLPRNRKEAGDEEQTKREIMEALSKISNTIEVPLYSDEEARTTRENKLAEDKENAKQRWQKDVEMVRQKRAAKLAKKFPELKIDLRKLQEGTTESTPNLYEQTKVYIYDYYVDRLKKIGRNGRDIDDYDFTESEYGERTKFDRNKITDVMLIRLKELTEHLEDRERERNRARV